MLKILHIIPDEKFTGPFIEFINCNFPYKEHLFFVHGKKRDYYDLSVFSNVVTCYSKDRMMSCMKVIPLIRESRMTIIHSLSGIWLVSLLNAYLCFSTRNSRPMLFWRVWGGDLYNSFLNKVSVRPRILQNLRRVVYLKMKARIIKNLYGIIAPVEGDYKYALQRFRTNANPFFKGTYSFTDKVVFDRALENRNDNPLPVFLLGNSAFPTNEHFEAIDILARLQINHQFKVLCPLSYGPEDYARKVISYGRKVLGNAFEAITSFMSMEDYIFFLASVDIAIMNQKRQQALGNMNILLQLGKKIYLRKENPAFEHYTNLGVKVFDIEDINRTPEDTFSWSLERAEKNRSILYESYSRERSISEWKEVFDS